MSQTSVYSPVCMVYSKMTLQEIESIFLSAGGAGQYGTMRIVRVKDENGQWQDSNRTIVLVTETLWNSLTEKGYGKPVKSEDRPRVDFRIVPYEVRNNNLPSEGLKKDLFIRIPKTSFYDSKSIETIIDNKMKTLCDLGVIQRNQYNVSFPIKNIKRETGQVTGSCFITFGKDVTPVQAAQVKAVIDDTYWPDKETFNCYWARDNSQMPNNQNQQPKKKLLRNLF